MFKIDMPPLIMEGWRFEIDFDAHGGWTTNRVSIPSVSFKEHKGQYIQCKIGSIKWHGMLGLNVWRSVMYNYRK